MHANQAMYKNAEASQKHNDLPPLLAGKFPRYINYVDKAHCHPILSVKRARLTHLSKITITVNPWQNEESDTAFEFWRRITPMEIRGTNAKCAIDMKVENNAGGEDSIVCEYIDGEKLVFETKYLDIDEVWYHFMVANLGRTEIAEKAAAGKMF